MMPDDDPVGYADAAQTYWDRGWRGVLPLNRGTKWPPPKSFTGYDGVDPSYADVLQWSELYPTGNLCLRLPDGVIGIDVDAYGAKTGAAAFAEAVNRWGPLPEGPQSSSRDDDLVSGLRLYRVPPGTLLETVIVFPELSIGDIEVIQPHHRYVVCWPSIHPEERLYRWRNSSGEAVAVPDLTDPAGIPDFPQSWLDGLKLTPRSLDMSVGQGYDTRLALTAGSPSPVVGARLQMAIKELNMGGMSRHDTCLRHVMAILRHGAEGQSGVEEALSLLREVFAAVVTLDGSRTREIAVVEFNRMVTNNNVARELSQPGILDWFRQVMDSQGRSELNTSEQPGNPGSENGPGAQDANANRAEDAGAVTLPGDALPGPSQPSSSGELEALEQDFWTSRRQHQVVFDAALSRMASPWAVMACVVARALALVSPSVTLPPVIGGRGSLNWFAAIVGKSGSGKGAAAAVARQLVSGDVLVLPIGSGEGMVECYRRAPAKKGEMPDPVVSVMFELPEIDSLGSMVSRSGQTTMSVLRSGFSGEKLGFSYRGKQSEGVAEHSYRMTLTASVQPSRAGALLEDAGGGTPQRFMWFPGSDRRIDVDGPEWPKDLTGGDLWLDPNFPSKLVMSGYELSGFFSEGAVGNVVIPEEVRLEIASAHAARARGESDALDGHTLFCREKLAFGLAYIDGRAEISLEDWRLSGIATAVSEWTRNRAVDAYQLAKEDEFRDRGQLKGVESAAAKLGESQEMSKRVSRLVEVTLRKIRQAMPDGVDNRDLISRTTARDRDLLPAALEWLQGQGQIGQVEGTKVWVTL